MIGGSEYDPLTGSPVSLVHALCEADPFFWFSREEVAAAMLRREGEHVEAVTHARDRLRDALLATEAFDEARLDELLDTLVGGGSDVDAAYRAIQHVVRERVRGVGSEMMPGSTLYVPDDGARDVATELSSLFTEVRDLRYLRAFRKLIDRHGYDPASPPDRPIPLGLRAATYLFGGELDLDEELPGVG